MQFETNLDACINRFMYRINTMGEFMNLVLKPIETRGNEKILKFIYESFIIRAVAFIENYLTCLVGNASVRKESLIRDYFKEHGNERKKQEVRNCHELSILSKHMEAEVSFKKDAKKTKRVFEYLFNFSPFPHREIEDLIHDAVLVRNIIIHEGGIPSDAHANQMRNQGIIVVSEIIA